MKNISLFIFTMGLACSAIADDPTTKYRLTGDHVSFSIDGHSKICVLDRKVDFATESFDESAIIVSERGYVSTEALIQCGPETLVRVSLIPKGVGILADINLRKRIYVSLDYVSVRPLSYLATVARLDSTRNLVNLDGAYVPGRTLAEMQQHSFGSSGGAGSAAISPDGRYVAAAGRINCGRYGSPGVWDIEKNRRVMTDDDSCARLFDRASKD